MKKTSSINIGGIILHIEEDAYERLNGYIKLLEKHFQKYPEKADIIGDIEQRIGELLTEELSGKEAIITLKHVEKIIAIMGNPEDFDTSDTEENDEQPLTTEKKPKKLFRNPEGKIIGGIASGFAVYLTIDPLIIRLALIILTLFGAGFPIPLYIILWILIPEAQSRTQKMEMMGESITIESIKKNAQNSIDDIKSSVKDFTSAPATRHAIAEIGVFIGKIAPTFFNILFGISIAAISISIVFLIILKTSSQVICWDFPPTLEPEVLNFLTNIDILLLSIGVLLIGAAAITSLLYILPNAIWGKKESSRIAVQLTSALTAISIIIIIIALTKSIIDYHAVKEFIFYGGSN